MSLISRLESKFGRYSPPNVTLVLVAGQVICYLAGRLPLNDGRGGLLQSIQLVPDQVASGEVWRVVTYLFEPPSINPLFAFFFWYLFYLFGTTLESTWNTFRYNVYLLIGYLASLVFAFIGWWLFNAGGVPAPNSFLYGSVFLAFARLYPDFTLNLFFILPVKVKWLALVTWIIYAYTLITDPWLSKLMIVAAVLNYLLFFGRDILRDMKQGHQRMQHQPKTLHSPKRLIHRCRICDLSIEDAPRTPFRYCTKCASQCCYCPEHINNHEHVVAEPVEETPP